MRLLWRKELTCPDENCGISFELDSPADLSWVSDIEYQPVKGSLEPKLSRRILITHCPLCGRQFTVDCSTIPEFILKKVSSSKSNAFID